MPGIAECGLTIARDAAEFAALAKANAARSAHVLAAGEQAELDAIHAEALAGADTLNVKLAAAERR